MFSKKQGYFSPKIGWRKKEKDVKFSAILRLKNKKKKKVPMAIKLEGGGLGLNGLAISGGTFFLRLPLISFG